MSWQSFKRLLPALIYMVFLLAIALLPLGPPGGNDKMAHALSYFILGLLLFWWASWQFAQKPAYLVALLVVGIGAAHGALIELLQGQIPWRTADLTDWQADIFGLLISLLAGLPLLGRQGKG
ncbi:VanZ family protein [Thermosulfuriphilus sp.]